MRLSMKKGEMREKIEKALEIPIELLKNTSRTTILGNESIYIENYKAITEYEENVIRFNNIAIYGTSLKIVEITSDDMVVSGMIKSIEFDN